MLKPKVFDLLLVLVEKNGHVVDKNELMKRLWPDTFVEESNLSVSIFALRKALGENQYGQSYIETVPRRGYRFVANLTEAASDGLAPATVPVVELKNKFETRVRVKSLAVLPFKLLGTPSTDEYLGLGLADALITRLTNLRQIRVRPTSAVRPLSALSSSRLRHRRRPVTLYTETGCVRPLTIIGPRPSLRI